MRGPWTIVHAGDRCCAPTVHPPRCAPQGEPSDAGPRVLRPIPFMRARENAFLRRSAEPFSDVQAGVIFSPMHTDPFLKA